MGFEFTDDATKFFQRIGVKRSNTTNKKSKTGTFESMLEAYWICAQIGIKHNAYLPAEKSTEFVRHLGPLSDKSDFIQGIAFYYYCKRQGLLSAENEVVLKEMSDFFSEEHRQLGDRGNQLLNAYANGGFETLYAQLGEDTTELSDVLCVCFELLNN